MKPPLKKHEYKNEIELLNEVWPIKDSGHHTKVTWGIDKKCLSYNPQTEYCLLCLYKKLKITAHKKTAY